MSPLLIYRGMPAVKHDGKVISIAFTAFSRKGQGVREAADTGWMFSLF
ncbi:MULTISPECIES: hypothetical protein [Pseudomonas]|nr:MULTISPECIES: hypothetical protein [Pseudomonas]